MPTPPSSSASETKNAQRTTSSRQVMPEAPTASVGGGASTPTPNVKTPVPTWPSADSSRQRTVYASPSREPPDGRADHAPAVRLRDDAGDLAAVRRVHDDRVGRRVDGLVEAAARPRSAPCRPGSARRARARTSVACAAAAAGRASATSAAAASVRLTARRPARRGRRGARRSARRRGRRTASPPARSTSPRTRTPRPRAAAGTPRRAGRPPRRRASSRSGGGGTPSARRASRSARGRGTTTPERKSAPAVTSDQ